MFNRNCLKYIIFGSLLLLLVVLIFMGFGYRGYSHQHLEERIYAAAHDVAVKQKPENIRCSLRGKISALCVMDQPDTNGVSEHAKAELKAQQDSAEFSMLSMMFSGLGLFVTSIGIVYVARTLGLSHREFIATHRPLLAIKEIYPSKEITESSPEEYAEGVFNFRIVNIGKTKAKIVEAQWDAGFNPVPNLKPLEKYDSGKKLSGHVIEGGGSIDESATYNIPQTSIASAYRSQKDHPHDKQVAGIYMRGFIIYEDSNCIRRRVGWCRRWSFNPDQFIKIDNDDFEYAD